MATVNLSTHIDINTTADRIWKVLLDDATYRQWAAAFQAGSYAEGNWEAGSRMYFKASSGGGIISTVVDHVPEKSLVLEHIGLLKTGGIEDFSSEEAAEWQNLREAYHLEPTENGFRFVVRQDLDAAYENWFFENWPKALEILKSLAEADGVLAWGKDVPLLTVAASSFPEGVMQAHQTLHTLFPMSENRRYFGISHGLPGGKIHYMAAVDQQHAEDADRGEVGSFVLKEGRYLTAQINDFRKDISQIGKTIGKLLQDPRVDPQGYCVEEYLNMNDVLLLVLLK